MSDEIRKQITLDLLSLPTKYLALCEILAELTASSIEEVNDSVDRYVKEGYFTLEELSPEESIH